MCKEIHENFTVYIVKYTFLGMLGMGKGVDRIVRMNI